MEDEHYGNNSTHLTRCSQLVS